MTLRYLLLIALVAAVFAAPGCAADVEAPPFPEAVLVDPPNDSGEAIEIRFRVPAERPAKEFRIERSDAAEGPFEPVVTVNASSGTLQPDGTLLFVVTDGSASDDTARVVRGQEYFYRVAALDAEGGTTLGAVVGPFSASAEWWNQKKLSVFLAVVVFSLLVFYFIQAAKKDPDIYVRPIGGLAAIAEAIGRATEMGRPVLYVPGIAGMEDIQTITSLVIMREVAKSTAEYETDFLVPCRDPVVLTGAEEAVRTGFLEAGKPDLYKRDNVRFLSDEQFAFTAATNGIMLREKTAANLYIGAFWAESLILAETGFLCGAIQIAGTANVSQLPFFVAACDYTLIGEEIYAASAYLSREPMLMGSLKGSDWAKFIFAVAILAGVACASLVATGDGGREALYQPFIDFFAGK